MGYFLLRFLLFCSLPILLPAWAVEPICKKIKLYLSSTDLSSAEFWKDIIYIVPGTY